jgi:nicotinate-nucleotide adenylyltransferase
MSQAKRQRVALYGGAFDPMHNGHIATIAALLSSGLVDQVLVIPSGDRPDKVANTSASDRLAMTEQAVREFFSGDSRVSVSDLHAAKRVGFGTIDLLDYFKKDGTMEPLIVVGCELLKDLPSWKESARLKTEGWFLVIQRPGFESSEIPKDVNVTMLTTSYPVGVNVSSTTLRAMLAQGLSCAGLMPSSVIRFCKERGLYQRC